MKRALALLTLGVALLLLWPHAAPRPAADNRDDLPGTVTIQQRTGAPTQIGPVARASLSPAAATPTPHPSGGIGEPASYCRPGYCETPVTNPQPQVRKPISGIRGTATWYCRPLVSRCTVGYPFGMYAAAGPELRAMLGPDWRGQTVNVVGANGVGRLVVLIDACWCAGDHVIDLYWTAFRGLVNPVTVTP